METTVSPDQDFSTIDIVLTVGGMIIPRRGQGRQVVAAFTGHPPGRHRLRVSVMDNNGLTLRVHPSSRVYRVSTLPATSRTAPRTRERRDGSRRHSTRGGTDDDSSGEPEPPGDAGRLCAICGVDISHRRGDAQTCGDTHKRQLQRRERRERESIVRAAGPRGRATLTLRRETELEAQELWRLDLERLMTENGAVAA
jgi:hypothetical protein